MSTRFYEMHLYTFQAPYLLESHVWASLKACRGPDCLLDFDFIPGDFFIALLLNSRFILVEISV